MLDRTILEHDQRPMYEIIPKNKKRTEKHARMLRYELAKKWKIRKGFVEYPKRLSLSFYSLFIRFIRKLRQKSWSINNPRMDREI